MEKNISMSLSFEFLEHINLFRIGTWKIGTLGWRQWSFRFVSVLEYVSVFLGIKKKKIYGQDQWNTTWEPHCLRNIQSYWISVMWLICTPLDILPPCYSFLSVIFRFFCCYIYSLLCLCIWCIKKLVTFLSEGKLRFCYVSLRLGD